MDGMDKSMGGMNKSMGGGMGGMDMPMYFHKGTMVTLFFKDWMTMSQKEFNGACTALFFVAFLYEGLKVLRKFIIPGRMMRCRPVNKNSPGYSSYNNAPPSLKVRALVHLLQSLLHVIQVFIGYLLMLAFMTYNTLICVSVLLGYGVGYLAFAWKTPEGNASGADDSDCCNM